ncbi:MAG: 50S ribosomal protein L23 [Halobacteriota archaeon]|nr:50S ribosomal protein L23 [Halobacteriota archaeon]
MSVIKFPYVTEKATSIMDEKNTLTFMVDVRASKPQIRRDVEKLFDVTVVDVKTMITPKGEKKALVSLSDDDSADDIITRLGVF